MIISPLATLGLIGGMSWESSALYYRLFNERAREHLGGNHSMPLLMASLDFAEIEKMQRAGQWQQAGEVLADTAYALEAAGARSILLCTNTMHKLADQIEAALAIPLLHIADATARALKRARVQHPLLLGTRYTMEQDFYRQRLNSAGLSTRVPGPLGRAAIDQCIFQELCQGRINADSRQHILDLLIQEIPADWDGIILGCTELGLLFAQEDFDCPVIDTVVAHVDLGFEIACGQRQK